MEKSLLYQVSQKKRFKKLVLVLTTSMPVTVVREKAFRNAKTGKTWDKDENLGTNLV